MISVAVWIASLKWLFKGAYDRIGWDVLRHSIKSPAATESSVIQDMNLSNSYLDILTKHIPGEDLLQNTGS